MNCKCFLGHLNQSLSLRERLMLSKCKCSCRYTVSENHRTFRIQPHNPDAIDKIKIDGYMIEDCTIQKCDYLYMYKVMDEPTTVVFVELKGTDINHAVDQLDTTISLIKPLMDGKKTKLRACIVHSSYPRNDGTYRKKVMTLMKKHKGCGLRLEQYESRITYDCEQDKFIR